MGTFLRSLPSLEHSGTGKITITNFDARREYIVTRAGDPKTALAGTSVVDGVADCGGNYGDDLMVSLKANGKGTNFARRKITYTTQSRQDCTPNCRPISGNCFDGSGSCSGDGSCGADGTICCGGSMGSTCTTVYYNVKNPVPAGFTEKYGEWVKIPTEESTRFTEANSMSAVFDEDYYFSAPNPDPIEYLATKTPRFAYDMVVLKFMDEAGEMYAIYEQSADPQYFHTIFDGVSYEMHISKIEDLQKGTFELIWASSDTTIIQEVTGTVL